jgi:hypothetical protein
MTRRKILWLLVTLFGAISPACAKNPSSPIRVLIVDGFSNHDWRQTTLLLRGLLKQAGGFSVDVSTMPETGSAGWDAWRPRFADYDVVIQTCNDIGGGANKPAWPEGVKRDFAAYVRQGGGVYIFHSGQNAFVGWKEYELMAGLSWRDAGYGPALHLSETGKLEPIPAWVGRATGHGQRGNVLVTRLGDDPIHKGMPRSWLSPDMEVYYYARGPAKHLHVLAYARDSEPGLGWLWPVEWTTAYGRGRVYISTYGHVWKGDVDPPSLRCAAVQTIIPRALEWLARRPVTFPVPGDFPGTGTVSVRGPIASGF